MEMSAARLAKLEERVENLRDYVRTEFAETKIQIADFDKRMNQTVMDINTQTRTIEKRLSQMTVKLENINPKGLSGKEKWAFWTTVLSALIAALSAIVVAWLG